MGQLFLSGGGDSNQTRRLDRLFVAAIPKTKRLLYIPIAMPEKVHTMGACFDWFRRTMASHRFYKIDMWTDLSNRNYRDMHKYGSVYIGGGNTFSLLNSVRASGFDKLLFKYFKSGGIIYGGSAGAIILGKHIGTAFFGGDSDKNIVRIKDLRGLNLAKDYVIQCHYSSKDDKDVVDYVRTNKASVIALPENAGIIIAKGRIKTIGKVFLFKRMKNNVKKTVWKAPS